VSKAEESQEEAKMDMTPMIDAVFLLIIFFLCIDFKILESKLPAYLPKSKGSQEVYEEPVSQLSVAIEVTNNGAKRYRNRHGSATWQDPRTNEVREAAYQLRDHTIAWYVGSKFISDLDELKTQLETIYKNKGTWQKDPKTGVLQPMSVVIEPQINACYADVAQTVDAVTAASFTDINFGGGMGSGKAPR